MKNFSPRQIVAELDRYIVGQKQAKRAVAVAMRNRERRLKLDDEMQEEVKPKNLLMIGPTGVGKTEIARRLAKYSQAPFVKVEATKYTEVGYVGRDVESMVRDLVENAIRIVRQQMHEEVAETAEARAIERVAKALVPNKEKKAKKEAHKEGMPFDMQSLFKQLTQAEEGGEEEEVESEELASNRRAIRQQIRDHKLDKHEVTIKMQEQKVQLNSLKPKKFIERTVTVKEAVELLTDEEADKLVNQDDIHQKALKLAQESGIIFIDEMDKIAMSGRDSGQVSRQGVQRDILPIVEGSQVQTKYGIIATDHILFIGSGAFHECKPSDLIPELQGRFPIRVHLDDLVEADFVNILTQPKNALLKQYQALLATEMVEVSFTEDAIQRMAYYAVTLNRETDNIGARRLHTILETVLEELLFEAADAPMKVEINQKYVDDRLADKVNNTDLYIIKKRS